MPSETEAERLERLKMKAQNWQQRSTVARRAYATHGTIVAVSRARVRRQDIQETDRRDRGPPMILIPSKTYRESVTVAGDLALTPTEWRHITDLQSLQGLPAGLSYRHAGAFERRDAARDHDAGGCDIRGSDVRDM